jgi:hypothetical protein
MILEVQTVDRCLGFGIRAHFNKAKSLAPSGLSIHDHFGTLHGAEFGKHLLQLRARDTIAQITAIQFLSHRRTPNSWEEINPPSTFGAEWKGANVEAHQEGRPKEHTGARLTKEPAATPFVEPTAAQYVLSSRESP